MTRSRIARPLSDQVLYIVLGTGVRTVVDLCLMAVLARALTQTDFGVFRQVLLVYGLVAGIATLGLPPSLAFYMPGADTTAARRFSTRTLGVLALLCLVGTAFLLPFGAWIADSFGYAELQVLLALAFLLPLGQMSLETSPYLLIGLGRYGRAGAMSAIMALLQAGSVVAPAMLGAGLRALCLSASLAAGLNFLILLVIAFRTTAIREQAQQPVPSLPEQLRYSLPLGVQGMISTVSQRLDRLFIGLSFPPAILAVYSVGATEVPLVPVLPYTVGRALTPHFVRLHREGNTLELISLWHRSILKVGLVILPCFFLCFLLAPQLMTLAFGAGFVGAAAIFRIYLLMLPLRPTAYGTMLQALNDTPGVMYGSLLALSLNGVLGLALLSAIGWLGPAVGAVAAQVILILFYMRRIARGLERPWRDLWPWRRYAILIGVCVAASTAATPLLWLPSTPVIHIASVATTFCVVYVFGLIKLGELDKGDLDRLVRWTTLRLS